MRNRICVTDVRNEDIMHVTNKCVTRNGQMTSGRLGYSQSDVQKSEAKSY